MNLFGLSPGELLLIMMVALVVLGPEKLPETAASAGKWIREFRRATEELTAQFAAENPLAELQRAFSLTDEPVSQAADEDPTMVEAPVTLAEPDAEVTPMLPSPISSVPRVPARRRSEYFERPVYSPGIETAWIHGAVDERPRGRLARPRPDEFSVAMEWMHGAPLALPASSNGHNGHALASKGAGALSDFEGSESGASSAFPNAEDVTDKIEPQSDQVEVEERLTEQVELAPDATDGVLTTVSAVNGDGREGLRA